MNRLLLLIPLLPLLVLLTFWAWAFRLRSRYEAREWPEHLGTIEDAPKHFSHDKPNAAGFLLEEMVKRLEKRPKALGVYVAAQLERTAIDVEPPPEDVAAYLRRHDAEIELMRDHILHAGPIISDAAQPQMIVTRLLLARALATGSWDDLHVAWMLDRPMWEHRDTLQLALMTTRMLNAAAVKMPLPAPAWLDELRAIDPKRRFAAAAQTDAWNERENTTGALRADPVKAVLGGWRLIAFDLDFTEQLRVRMGELLATKRCDYAADPLSIKPLNTASWNELARSLGNFNYAGWGSIARFPAELEATEKTLALRAGRRPAATSRCSDGTWLVTPESIEFTRRIHVPADSPRFPLAHEVK